MKQNRKFINFITPAFYIWILKLIFGGLISGLVSFITKNILEKFRKISCKNKNYRYNKCLRKANNVK